jgi:hypothetical protein
MTALAESSDGYARAIQWSSGPRPALRTTRVCRQWSSAQRALHFCAAVTTCHLEQCLEHYLQVAAYYASTRKLAADARSRSPSLAHRASGHCALNVCREPSLRTRTPPVWQAQAGQFWQAQHGAALLHGRCTSGSARCQGEHNSKIPRPKRNPPRCVDADVVAAECARARALDDVLE